MSFLRNCHCRIQIFRTVSEAGMTIGRAGRKNLMRTMFCCLCYGLSKYKILKKREIHSTSSLIRHPCDTHVSSCVSNGYEMRFLRALDWGGMADQPATRSSAALVTRYSSLVTTPKRQDVTSTIQKKAIPEDRLDYIGSVVLFRAGLSL